MKKLLLLGAMTMHVPLIKRAKERGIYVITCDYLPENPGHALADEAHYDSTTDKEAVLALAKRCEVDGVMTFNSDPAALTAAYVVEQLGLPGSGYKAVEIMSEKDKFRQFLLENGFNTPVFGQYADYEGLKADIERFNFPVMVKPVDSSASKGISKVENLAELEDSFVKALTFTRANRVIVEEFIVAKGHQLHGDGFVQDGKVAFMYLGDYRFNTSVNDFVPISTTFPSFHTEMAMIKAEAEVKRFIEKVGFVQGGINIEVRISEDDRTYLIEVGPRSGGNFTPTTITYASGYNFIDAALDTFLGLDVAPQIVEKKGYYAYITLRTQHEGVLDQVVLAPILADKIVERYDYINSGDVIKSAGGVHTALGVVIVEFDSIVEMDDCVRRYDELYEVKLKG